MKKIFLSTLMIAAITFMLVSCKKGEKVENIVTYDGSVMIYTSLKEEEIKEIKNVFETKYKGVLIDYFFSDADSIKEILEEDHELDNMPNADVIFATNDDCFEEYDSKVWLESYESPELKNVDENYKNSKGNYYTACITEDGDNMSIALLKDCLNVDNGKLLIDFILSNEGQAILAKHHYKTVK